MILVERRKRAGVPAAKWTKPNESKRERKSKREVSKSYARAARARAHLRLGQVQQITRTRRDVGWEVAAIFGTALFGLVCVRFECTAGSAMPGCVE